MMYELTPRTKPAWWKAHFRRWQQARTPIGIVWVPVLRPGLSRAQQQAVLMACLADGGGPPGHEYG
jgi:hypothetical protein